MPKPPTTTPPKGTRALVDWYNIGGLARARTEETLFGLWSHYSWRELFIRGGIVVATAVSGMLAADTCKADTCRDESCSPLIRGFFGATAGFVGSHALAMISTLQRRNKIQRESVDKFLELKKHLSQLMQLIASNHPSLSEPTKALSTEINDKCTALFEYPLPVKKRGDVVRNLQTIKNLMYSAFDEIVSLQNKFNSLQDVDEATTLLTNAQIFWKQEVTIIQEQLLDHSKEYSSPSPH
jgi:hypothetical protein